MARTVYEIFFVPPADFILILARRLRYILYRFLMILLTQFGALIMMFLIDVRQANKPNASTADAEDVARRIRRAMAKESRRGHSNPIHLRMVQHVPHIRPN